MYTEQDAWSNAWRVGGGGCGEKAFRRWVGGGVRGVGGGCET